MVTKTRVSKPVFTLTEDGKAVITYRGIEMTEAEFDSLNSYYTGFMQPVWEARQRRKEAAERAETEAQMLQGQRVVDIDGVKVRIQGPWKHGYHDTFAWLDGCDRDTSPFIVLREGIGHDRPYGIRGAIDPQHWSYDKRREVYGKRNELRFSSIEAAIRRAIELKLHEAEH
jgi:hypothetical protein